MVSCSLAETVASALEEARRHTLRLMRMVPDKYLPQRVHSFYSPIGWHMGHVAMVEEYWVLEKAFDEKPHRPEFSFIFANVPENPKDNRVNLPSRIEIETWMSEVRIRVLDKLAICAEDGRGLLKDLYAFRFALQHEHQHQETIAELMQIIGDCGNGQELAVVSRQEPCEQQMLFVRGGSFLMGTDDLHAYDNEKRRHDVEVRDFYMAKLPVSVAEYGEFLKREPGRVPAHWKKVDGEWSYQSPFGLRKMNAGEPVCGVNHFDARAFADWKGMRLPTEAEWEYVASDGGNNRFPTGNEEPSERDANFAMRNWGPIVAGSYPANAFGICDLAGQVWEWTSSKFVPYPGFEPFPYEGYSSEHFSGEHFVLRGGSWASMTEILRCTFRNWYVPTYRHGFLGMRLAKDA